MTTSPRPLDILVVGATGSVGRHVVDEALAQGHRVRVLVRDLARAQRLPEAAHRELGDLTLPGSLAAAVSGVDAVVFTHGFDAGSRKIVEDVDYGGVRNVLAGLRPGQRPRIALMAARAHLPAADSARPPGESGLARGRSQDLRAGGREGRGTQLFRFVVRSTRRRSRRTDRRRP